MFVQIETQFERIIVTLYSTLVNTSITIGIHWHFLKKIECNNKSRKDVN